VILKINKLYLKVALRLHRMNNSLMEIRPKKSRKKEKIRITLVKIKKLIYKGMLVGLLIVYTITRWFDKSSNAELKTYVTWDSTPKPAIERFYYHPAVSLEPSRTFNRQFMIMPSYSEFPSPSIEQLKSQKPIQDLRAGELWNDLAWLGLFITANQLAETYGFVSPLQPTHNGPIYGPEINMPKDFSHQSKPNYMVSQPESRFDTGKQQNQVDSSSLNYKEIMVQLDKQSVQKTVQIDIYDETYVLENNDLLCADELQFVLAEKMYDSIRNSNNDTESIAKFTKFKQKNIKHIKDHVFYRKHTLDRYGPNNIEQKRFDASLEQAVAWKRLESGTYTAQDITWIKHECAERHHELKFESGYSAAHERAQKLYDGYPWQN